MPDPWDGVIGVELDFTVISGSALVAKDGSGFLKLGKKSTSDPYVVVHVGKTHIAETHICQKTLNPEWNQTFKWVAEGRSLPSKASDLVFAIFDRDRGTSDDPMGEVRLPLVGLFSGHVNEASYQVNNCPGCKDATGTLKLRVSCAVRRSLSLDKGKSVRLESGIVAVGLGWDMLAGNRAIDLDTSCVALKFDGTIAMDECVYFAQLFSKSGAIRHTGDEREGDEDLGQGDDEIIIVDTSRLPARVCALFFVATVATEGCSFADVKSARMRLVDWIMRKGGVIRVKDYCPHGVPASLVLGLSWDVTHGVNIDLDASAILLDVNLRQIDLVFFGKLGSSDGSIRHGGDEREGDEKGDDEKIFLDLRRVHPAVAYIGFVINSYSGQELDDVKDAGCHLFDGSSYRDIASFRLTNAKFLDKHTALVVGMLFRDGATGEWGFEIISEAAQGRTAHDNVDELQRFIQRRPPRALPQPRLPPGNAQGMMARTSQVAVDAAASAATGVAGVATGMAQLMRTASGRLFPAGGAPPPHQPPVVAVAVQMPPGQMPPGQMPPGQMPPVAHPIN